MARARTSLLAQAGIASEIRGRKLEVRNNVLQVKLIIKSVPLYPGYTQRDVVSNTSLWTSFCYNAQNKRLGYVTD